MRTCLLGLLVLVTACRRPSTQFAAMLSPVVQPADYTRHLKAGDELVAQGTDPLWSLTVNPSKGKLFFKWGTHDSLTTAVPERQADADGLLRFNAPIESGSLNVVFRPDSCVDAKTAQRYDYRVQVDVHSKNYVGCGVSLQKVTLLQDSWVLTDFQGRSITAGSSGNGVPRLEISLTEGRITGTTGCNRLSGNVKADTHLIAFGPMVMTKMACPGETGTFDSTFLQALLQPLTYEVADRELTLFREGKSLMAFKKAD